MMVGFRDCGGESQTSKQSLLCRALKIIRAQRHERPVRLERLHAHNGTSGLYAQPERTPRWWRFKSRNNIGRSLTVAVQKAGTHSQTVAVQEDGVRALTSLCENGNARVPFNDFSM